MLRGVILLFSFFFAAAAFAGEEGGSDYGEPFLAGARQDGASGNTAVATVVELTGEELIARGARSAAEALQFAAGCYVYGLDRWPDRGERMLRVNGAAPTDLRVLIDGVPVEHGVFGTVDLRDLPADQIALIRVYPGPAPAVYGVEGGAAVVEIITRQAGEHFIGRFDGRLGDHRTGYFSLGLGDTYRGFRYFIDADHDTTAGFPLPQSYSRDRNEDGGVRENSSATRDHFRGRAGASFGPLAEAHVSAFYDRSDRDIPADTGAVDPLYVRFPDTHRLGGQLNARLGAFGPFSLRTTGYLFEYVEHTEDYAEATYDTLVSRSRTRDLRMGGDLIPALDFGSLSLVTAVVGGRHDDLDFEIRDQYRQRIKTNRLNVTINDELKPTPWLQFSLGTGYGRLMATQAVDFEPGDPATGWHARFGAAVGPFAGFTARAVAGRNPRFPTVEEWFDGQIGNPNLGAALVDNLQLGFDYAWVGYLRVAAVGFLRTTQGAPKLTATDDSTRPLVYADSGDYLTRGFTLAVESTPLPGLLLRANYSRLQNFDSHGNEIAVYYQPEQTAAGEACYRFAFGLGLGVNATFADETLGLVEGVENTMPWYSLLGARMFYTYRDRIEVYLQGANLTDTYYENRPYYPEPGRTFEAGLKLTYF